jgi:hypothetical protein
MIELVITPFMHSKYPTQSIVGKNPFASGGHCDPHLTVGARVGLVVGWRVSVDGALETDGEVEGLNSPPNRSIGSLIRSTAHHIMPFRHS